MNSIFYLFKLSYIKHRVCIIHELYFKCDVLQSLSKHPTRQLRFLGERVLWIQPSTLKELLELKALYPTAKLVVGNTEVGEPFSKKCRLLILCLESYSTAMAIFTE